jgi:hypothetical protein
VDKKQKIIRQKRANGIEKGLERRINTERKKERNKEKGKLSMADIMLTFHNLNIGCYMYHLL